MLENGTVFEGESLGAERDTVGALVFTTGVVGYTEALTDEAYFGQIVLFTFPTMGNYGVNEADTDGNCALCGVVLRELCEKPSNFRMEKSLGDYLKNQNIPAIGGVDTRELTKILRENGSINAKITHSLTTDTDDIKAYKIVNAAAGVTVKEKITVKAPNEKYKVGMLDLGGKRSMIKALTDRDCTVNVIPASATAEEILSEGFDGLLLSSGPEEHSEVQIEKIKALFGKMPILAIGVGHQLLALANGASVEKMPQGHRGTNQPAKDLSSGRTYITSQNHGYTVVNGSVKCGQIAFVNANDGSCEGVEYPENKAFSVQFVPDTKSGSYGTAFVYDRFVALMEDK